MKKILMSITLITSSLYPSFMAVPAYSHIPGYMVINLIPNAKMAIMAIGGIVGTGCTTLAASAYRKKESVTSIIPIGNPEQKEELNGMQNGAIFGAGVATVYAAYQVYRYTSNKQKRQEVQTIPSSEPITSMESTPIVVIHSTHRRHKRDRT